MLGRNLAKNTLTTIFIVEVALGGMALLVERGTLLLRLPERGRHAADQRRQRNTRLTAAERARGRFGNGAIRPPNS